MIFRQHLKKFALLKGVLILFLSPPAFAEEQCPTYLVQPKDHKVLGEIRSRTLKNWDKILTWSFSKKKTNYVLAVPPQEKNFFVTSNEILGFDRNYGYFSVEDPLVGKATKQKDDIKIAECLLEVIDGQIQDPEQKQFSLDEVLSKVLAYRALEKGMEVSIPEPYIVDELIDLWHGMPAYGLIPKNNKQIPSILLFRGTDLSFSTERGWASIMSDLDILGPGLSTFMKARPKIHEWLLKVKANGQSARVVGVSLGGVLASYTFLFEKEQLSSAPSVAFNPPGVSEDIFKMWEKQSETDPSFFVYVTQGDLVSKIGHLIGDVKEMRLPFPLHVIEAHVTLISAQKEYSLAKVNLKEENASRKLR
ncbi:MAG TPA: hypothetical protein VLG76_00455 [Rhabdochlamydiaceae bacterium]|nr:hypothetical protein [Rhabdochlamydiaceae bacterium]